MNFFAGVRRLVEALEGRQMLSTVTWANAAGGFWDIPSNWTGGVVPTAGDDVVISAPSATVTVRYGASAASVVSTAALTVTAGVFSPGTVKVSNAFRLNGGTLSGATVLPGSAGQKLTLTDNSTTLDGVTLNADLDVTGDGAHATVLNGLTLNGTATLGSSGSRYSRLEFAGSETLGGTGTVVFASGAFVNPSLRVTQANTTLTIGPSMTVRGGTPSNGYPDSYAAQLGYLPNLGGPANVYVINRGTISADTGLLSVNGARLTNVAGGTLKVAGGTLSLAEAAFSNAGTLSVASGAMNLGGAFATADLNAAGISHTGGMLNLTGTLVNTGATLALTSASGAISLRGGTLRGGTVTGAGGGKLAATDGNGTLDGVTLNADLDVSGDGAVATVVNGLTLNGTATLGSLNARYSRLEFAGTQTLGGTGTVAFASNAYVNPALRVTQASTTLTIGPSMTVRGGSTSDLSGGYAKIGYVLNLGGAANVSVVNYGTIVAESGTIGVEGSIVTNAAGGQLLARGGATLAEGGPWSNAGTALADGGTLSLNGAGVDTGTLSARGTGALVVSGNAVFSGAGILTSDVASSAQFKGGVTGPTPSASVFAPQGTTTLNGSGTSTAPQLVETMGADLGAIPAGFVNNFVYGTLALANNTYVRLTDAADNVAGSAAEAVYAKQLVVPAGTTLDLNGLHLYVRASRVAGTILNGTVTTVPDGGPLTLADWTPGKIAVAGEADDWTFYARAGRRIAVQLNPGTSGQPAPLASQLLWASVQLLDAAGNVLDSAVNSTGGGIVNLANVAIPASGNYRIRVTAAPGHASAVGNYIFTAYDVTPDARALNLNQTTFGTVETPLANDQWTFAAAAGQQVQFDLLGTTARGLTFTLTGPGGYTAFSGLTDDSALVTLPTSGTYTLAVNGTGGATGGYSFVMRQTSQTTLALGSTFAGALIGSGQAQLFKVSLAATQALSVDLNDTASADHVEIYVARGSAPTRESYLSRSTAAGGTQSVLIPSAAAGDYYILVFAEHVPASTTFTLRASGATVLITSATPNATGNAAPVSMTITGAGFVAGAIAVLVASNGSTIAPTELSVDSFTQLTATFPAGIATGQYALRVTNGSSTATRANAVTLSAGGAAHLETNLVLPDVLGRHQTATLYLTYANTGTVAMAAPLLVVSNPNDDRPLLTLDQSKLVEGFWSKTIPAGFSTTISILASGKTAGLLQPGESITVPIYYAGLQQPWDLGHTTTPFDVGAVTVDDATPLDWTAMSPQLRPGWASNEAWAAILPNVLTSVGTTYGDYVRLLDGNAQYLGRLGENVVDVGKLWDLTMLAANSLSPLDTLADSTDASIASPGLSLAFGRSYGQTIRDRDKFGAFGYGWSVPWQESLRVESDGTVISTTSDGGEQYFEPDSRHVGQYFSYSDKLVAGPNGTFVRTQTDGLTTGYRADGKLDYIRDLNGNQITAVYTSGKLTGLTHTSGPSLAITYNAAGLIASVTGSDGREATYRYDASNQYLLSSTTSAGTTTYTYNTSGNVSRLHALTSVGSPDGTHDYYFYDTKGRLSAESRDGDAERIAFTYDQPGEVTTTDLLGNASGYFLNEAGHPAKLVDTGGNQTNLTYDDASGQLIRVVDAAGASQAYTYDASHNVTSITDALGNKTSVSYGTFGRATSIVDAKGNATKYAYDVRGNLATTTYADNSVEQTSVDAAGNPTSFVRRSGQATAFTYNAGGQVTKEMFADGTHVDFAYDAHGNLHTATDATGVTTLDYDAADRLSKVTYANGRFLQFTVVNGRRTRMRDGAGYDVNYVYDTVGRLSQLTDASNVAIVTYAYDAAGQLARKDNGNGTYTTYAHDGNGNILHIVNFAPGGASVNSRFDYTYDALGRCTAEGTLDGAWTYAYDDAGQLTHAVFASTNANIPSQDLAYQYDALGNRTATILNGATTAYASNNLNQYTSVGGTSCTYDADGNLTFDGTRAYAYDLLDRLTSVTDASGTTSYAYDALGNRSSSTSGGQITSYLSDPFGLGNSVEEFDGTGAVTAQNVYGLGLTRRSVGGNSYFYDFDAAGSTADLTGAAGAVANRYRYNPFGDLLSSAATVGNPFQFVGQFGVESAGAGTSFMRARFYSPTLGRFTSTDPLGLGGGQINLYAYAKADPINVIDPSGACTTAAQRAEIDKAFDDEVSLDLDKIHDLEELDGVGETDPATGGPRKASKKVEREIKKLRDDIKRIEKQKHDADIDLILDKCPDDPPKPKPPVPPPASPRRTPKVPMQIDPNDKIGPAGFGSQHFVAGTDLLNYKIDFEDDPTATAPAQYVGIADQLSPSFDWGSFAFTGIGFGDTTIAVPAGAGQHFQTIVPLTYNAKTFNVEVEVGIHTDTGQVYATFYSIDPTTSLPPDVLTGFLPPEDGTGRGMGYIAYTVKAKAGLATGTVIRNTALVDFGLGAGTEIATDQVAEHDASQGVDPTKQAPVTIDAAGPTSTVAALPASQTTPSFAVTWSGSDDAGGSGVAGYTIFVSDNGGTFLPWLTNTTATTATYAGQVGHAYSFYSVATDNVGNVQATPAAAQATTSIVAPVTVTSVTMNGNNAALAGGQRSMVNGIVYTFSEPVTIAANAFALAIHAGLTGTLPTMSWAAINPDANGASTRWAVTFTGAGVAAGSIADGVYDITLNAAVVTAIAHPSVATTARATDTFYRLFGDYTGDGRVNNGDYAAFLNTNGLRSNQAGYLAAFDVNGDGRVNNGDYASFLTNNGKRYSGFTSTI